MRVYLCVQIFFIFLRTCRMSYGQCHLIQANRNIFKSVDPTKQTAVLNFHYFNNENIFLLFCNFSETTYSRNRSKYDLKSSTVQFQTYVANRTEAIKTEQRNLNVTLYQADRKPQCNFLDAQFCNNNTSKLGVVQLNH